MFHWWVGQKPLQTIVFCICLIWIHGCGPNPYDVILKNGKVYDGSGGFFYKMDVGIQSGQVVAMGKLDETLATHLLINAEGKMIVPWIPETFKNVAINKDKVTRYYQAILYKQLKKDTQTIEGALKSVFTQKVKGAEGGVGLIGTNCAAHILVLDLQKTEAYAPALKMPIDALAVEYVIYQGKALQ